MITRIVSHGKLLRGLGWAALILALGSVALLYTRGALLSRSEGPPVWGTVPEFEFTAHTGQKIGLNDLKGSLWVADFFFTSCGNICPIMQSQMKRIQKTFADRSEVKLVSFSVDPERDTPQHLRTYAEQMGVQPNRWFLLTGEKPQIYRLARQGFRLAVEDAPPASEQGGPRDFIHSDRFVLVDSEGRIRGYYHGTDPADVERLIQDIRGLLP